MNASASTIGSNPARRAIASASRTEIEPAWHGALRVCVATASLTALACLATWSLGIRESERRSLAHLEVLRDAAVRDVSALVEGQREHVLSASTDPRMLGALENFSGAMGETIRLAASRSAAQQEADRTRLLEFYATRPSVEGRLGGQVADLLPDARPDRTTDAALFLQSFHLPARVPSRGGPDAYTESRRTFDPIARSIATASSWRNLHLVDQETGLVLYSLVPGPETYTSLDTGVHGDGPLAGAFARTGQGDSAPGISFFAGARGEDPLLIVLAPLLDGSRRLGTLLAEVEPHTLARALLPGRDESRWQRAGLGASGEIGLWTADGRPLSRPRQGPARMGRAAPLPQTITGIGGADGSRSRLRSAASLSVGDRTWVVEASRDRVSTAAASDRLPAYLLALVLVAGALGWVVGGRIWKRCAAPLRDLSRVLENARRGDPRARVPIREGGSTEALATAINQILDDHLEMRAEVGREREALRRDAAQILAATRRAADGGAGERAGLESDTLIEFSVAIESLFQTIGDLSAEMAQARERLGPIGASLDELSSATAPLWADHARFCREGRDLSQHLLDHSGRVAQRFAEVRSVTQQAARAARGSRSAVADLTSGIDLLQRENRGASMKIKRLAERSVQISAMLATISRMSAQTDMLALNASIEASRAGEEGQGFSLVAEEMRKLAEEAAAAAREIERLVEGIQLDVTEAVGGMDRQTEVLGVHAAAADAIGQALERVGEVSSEAETTTSGLGDDADGEVETLEALAASFAKLETTTRTLREGEDLARQAAGEIDELLRDFDRRPASIDPGHTQPPDCGDDGGI